MSPAAALVPSSGASNIDVNDDVASEPDRSSELSTLGKAYTQRILTLGSRICAKNTLLVTGGYGFIGSNFINYWVRRFPADLIVNFDCISLQSNPRNIENPSHSTYCFVKGNLTDHAHLALLFAKYRFTHVIHFAAASNVDQSFSCPISCTVSNVLGTHTLLDVCKTYGQLSLFLHISTDEVYGEKPEGTCYEISSPFSPTNPYSASKAGAECLVMSYGKSFKLPYIITRSNNVYGKYQYPLQAIPRFVTSVLEGKPVPVHGKGLASRTFIHTLDKCAALEILMDRGTVGSIYNIGTEDEITVMELCRSILHRMLGKDVGVENWIVEVADRCYNDCRYSVNTDKLRELGWEPKISFDTGLEDTIRWYEENPKHWSFI